MTLLLVAALLPSMLPAAGRLGPRGWSGGFAARFEEIKAQASPEELYRLLWALPKGGDLHNHHEYSVPAEDWLALSTDPRFVKTNPHYTRVKLSDCGAEDTYRLQFQTIRESAYRGLPSCVQADFRPLAALSPEERAAWVSSMTLDLAGEGREEFFEGCVPRVGSLEQSADLIPETLVRQLQQAAAEHLLYVETQLDARNFVFPDGSPMPWKASAERCRRRLAAPDAVGTGVSTRLQISVVRYGPNAEDRLASAFEFVHQNRDLWVGVNLVGREDNPAGKAARFQATLPELRRRYADIGLSLHAGESELAGREVREALLLGADRIGHGTNLISDPDTMLLLRGGRFLVEVSLVSNQLLGYVPDLSRHPFPEYLRLGIPVCLNTDDRGVFDSNMTDEYTLAVKHFDLSWAEVVAIGRNSLEFSFAEPELKRELIRRYASAVAAFEARFNRSTWRQALPQLEVRKSGYSRRHLGLQRSLSRRRTCQNLCRA